MDKLKEEIMKEYKATLVGRDRFEKEMMIKQPLPQLFIPKDKRINAYLETPHLHPEPPEVERVFVLNKEKSWKNELIYEEL